jgi:hypothetical protein
MHLYASGSQAPGHYYRRQFTGAGVYLYTSAEDTPGFGGTITIAPTLTPATGTTATTFTLTWATAAPKTGYVYDIQLKGPGGSYSNYLTGTTTKMLT